MSEPVAAAVDSNSTPAVADEDTVMTDATPTATTTSSTLGEVSSSDDSEDESNENASIMTDSDQQPTAAAATTTDASATTTTTAEPTSSVTSENNTPTTTSEAATESAVATPITEAPADTTSTTSAAASSTTAPASSSAPSTGHVHKHDVYFTLAQAANENKKLKLGCGWRWMAVDPIVRPILPTVVELTPRQPRRTKGAADEELPPPPPITPVTGRGRKSSVHTPAAAAAPTPTPKGKGTKRSAPADPVDEKKKQLDELEARIAALRNEQAMLTGAAPAPATPSATEQAKKKPRKSQPPPVTIPTTPAMSRAQSTTATPATPSTSRTGRTVKAPQHYAEEVDNNQDVKQLKKCKVLLEHLAAHKLSQGIFSIPVNYTDPSKLYFAPNYLQIIGESNHPIHLGEIRDKLTNNEYSVIHEFAADVRMVFRNAMLYNPPGDWIHNAAADCLRIFEREISRIELGTDAKRPRTSTGAGEDDRAAKRVKQESKLSRLQAELASADVSLMEQMVARINALEAKLASSQPRPGGADALDSPPFKPVPPPYRGPSAAASTPKAKPQQPQYKPPPPMPQVKAQQPLTQREKQQLKDDIFKLPTHKLGPVVEIISKAMPKSEQKDDADEIEIDIDKLDIPTLRDLQSYVKKALVDMKKKVKQPTQPRVKTPATGPRASPAFPKATPTSSSPATQGGYPGSSAPAVQPSPTRLETPATPNLGRVTSQAVGNTTPALKYDSSSDDSDSSSDSDSDDDDVAFPSHIQPNDELAPSILDPQMTLTHDTSHTNHSSTAQSTAAASESDSDDDDAVAAAWGAPTPTTGTTAPTASAPNSAIWSDFQRSAAELKAKEAQQAEADRLKAAQVEREKAQAIADIAARKSAIEQAELDRAADEQRQAEEKAAKLEADREAARRAREARAAAAVAAAAPSGVAVSQQDMMEDMEHLAHQDE